ncbi:carbohydrate kinase family protein [Dyadobacter bucti]|jgi:fructokinase|uniref:carbohydrate kinase family protein n=1 Tax=Dyadobacter bucti TaxID=2572203 RepID=UPI003F725D52
MAPKVTVFGEVLWDVLPGSKLAGGAPMNVVAHLHNYGIETAFISRVGNDELGAELMAFIQNQGLPTGLIQTGQTHLTGIAKANISDTNEVTYKILHPVAWDYLQFEEKALQKIKESDLFVYGSLAARDDLSRETLLTYLENASMPVFDVNLRPPHYTREGVLLLMEYASVVKMNEHELKEITGWLTDYENDRQAMAFLKKLFRLQKVILTCGADGAMVLTETDEFFSHPGFRVKVADTIGSGDAFLAAFLYQTLHQQTTQDALEFACAAGACVATRQGALPAFTENDIHQMIRRQHAGEALI